MAVVIIAAPQDHLLFDPHQVVLEGEAGGHKRLDEADQQRPRRDRCVAGCAAPRPSGRQRQRGSEKLVRLRGRERIVRDVSLYSRALVQVLNAWFLVLT